MKVLLVAPPSNQFSLGMERFFLIEPLALEYVGAGISGHHDVKLVDLRVPNCPGFEAVIDSFEPDVVGITGFTIDVNTIKALLSIAKARLPDVLTVVGGHHATMVPSDFFSAEVDVVVVGEGVLPFRRICECHEKRRSFREIENIFYRPDGPSSDMVFTAKGDFPPLDSLPFPNRELSAPWREKYVYPLMFKPNEISYLASIRGSVGCVHRCNFCCVSKMFERRVYHRSIDNIMAELATIKEPVVYWVDDEFLLDSRRAAKLAEEVEKAGVKKTFWFYGRVDRIVQHPECIEAWARVGLRVVLMGLEAHSDDLLRRMGKGTSLSKNEEALRICHRNRVQVRGNFIVQPDFDREDFRKLSRYARKLEVDLPGFSILTPFPGTDLYQEVKDRLVKTSHDFFDMGHVLLPTKLPIKEFYEEYSKVLLKGTSWTRKFKLYRQIHPKFRKTYSRQMSEFMKRIRNVYLDH